MAWQRTRTAALIGVGLVGLAAGPAHTTPLVVLPTRLDFAVVDQSVWDLPSAVIDSGLKSAGMTWPATGNQPLQVSTSFDTGGEPAIAGDFTVRSTGSVGVDFRAILNGGSVSADYIGSASLAIAELDPADGKRRFSVKSAETVGARASMSTAAPSIDVESNFNFRLNASAGGTLSTITQREWTLCLPFNLCITFPEQGHSLTIPLTQLANVNSTKQLLKLTNEDLLVFGNSIANKNDLFREESADGQLAITFDLPFNPLSPVIIPKVVDESNPALPSKPKTKDPGDLVSVEFSMGDITVYAPALDTADEAFASPGGGGTVSLSSSGMTKLLKLDLDVDFLVTTAIGLSTGTPIPFGATLEAGFGPIKITETIDLIDADLGAVLFAAQNFDLQPKPVLELKFSDTVRYRLAGTEEWLVGDTAYGDVGDEFEVEYDGVGDLKVTPSYGLSNDFTNRTSLLLGEQFAMDLLKFEVRLPFDLATIGPLQLGPFVIESPEQLPLLDIFNQTFSLDFNSIEAQSITIGGVAGAAAGDFVGELVTGSPASLTQSIATPDDPFTVAFDYLFETLTGELTILLDGIVLGTLLAPAAPQGDFLTALLPVFDPLLLGRDGIDLTFLFDGPADSMLLLDNIGLIHGDDSFVGLANGDFQSGNLAGWIGLSSAGGAAGVRNLGLVVVAVPAPPALYLLLPVLAAFVAGRRLSRGWRRGTSSGRSRPSGRRSPGFPGPCGGSPG